MKQYLWGLQIWVTFCYNEYTLIYVTLMKTGKSRFLTFLISSFIILVTTAVKEFLETAKEEFEEKWKNPYKVSTIKQWLMYPFLFFSFSVQDFLDKAKKDFEEKWAKNPQVSPVWSNYQSLFDCLLFFTLTFTKISNNSFWLVTDVLST